MDMNVVIPKSLQKQIRQRAQERGVTEQAYVKTALAQAVQAEESLAEEMRPWNEAYLHDFAKFAKKHKL